MIEEDFRHFLENRISASDHPREQIVDTIFSLQDRYGYLSDELLAEVSMLFEMSHLEIEEIATFYEFIYRKPVGKYVIHVCDGVVCWMNEYGSVLDHIRRKLNIDYGQTSHDGRFTLLPTCCIGYCDRSPAMMINRRVYGRLSPEKIDDILKNLD